MRRDLGRNWGSIEEEWSSPEEVRQHIDKPAHKRRSRFCRRTRSRFVNRYKLSGLMEVWGETAIGCWVRQLHLFIRRSRVDFNRVPFPRRDFFGFARESRSHRPRIKIRRNRLVTPNSRFIRRERSDSSPINRDSTTRVNRSIGRSTTPKPRSSTYQVKIDVVPRTSDGSTPRNARLRLNICALILFRCTWLFGI